MFDLNQQIAQWRQSLGQSESIVRSDLDELESHLRDQIDHLSLAGLSPQEALLVARHRIGDTKRLPDEFAKVNGSAIFRRRLQWMLIGVVTYLLLLNLASLASTAGTLAAFGVGFHGYLSGWIGQGTQFLVTLAGLALVIAAMKSPGITRLTGSSKGGLFIGLIIVVGSILLIAAQFLTKFLLVRLVGVEDFGKSAFILNGFTMAYSVVIPILVVTLLLVLRRPARQQELGVD